MSRRQHLAVALATGLWACGPKTVRVEMNAPPGVERIGVVLLGDGGRLLGATGLLPRSIRPEEQLASLIAAEDELTEVVAVGYTADQLAAAAGAAAPNDEVLRRSPLMRSEPTDPRLPTPFWIAAGPASFAGSVILEPRAEAFDLRTNWLPPCPRLIPSGEYGVIFPSCSGDYCGQVTALEGCELNIKLTECLLGSPPSQFAVGPRGELTGVGGDRPCEPAPAAEGEAASFSCAPGCTHGLLVSPFLVSLEVSRPVVVEPAARPDVRPVTANVATFGHVFGVVPRPAAPGCRFPGPRVVVGVRSEARRCAGAHRLVVVDAESLQILANDRTWDGCAAHLTPDPAGDGVVVITADPAEVVRLDCNLDELGRWPIPGADAPLSPLGAEVIPRDPGGDEIWVGLGDTSPALPPALGRMVRFSGRSLEHLGTIELGPWVYNQTTYSLGFNGPMAALGPNRVVAGVVERDVNALHLVLSLDLSEDPLRVGRAVARSGGGLPDVPEGLSAAPGRGELLATALSDHRISVLRIGGPDGFLDNQVFDYTRPGTDLTGAAPFPAPGAPGEAESKLLVITTAAGGTRPESWVGLYDYAQRRLEPGRLPLGFGPAGPIRYGEPETVWVPLPWQGAIVRVRPGQPIEVRP